MGGFYERLVGMVKDCMRRGLQEKSTIFRQLEVIIAEKECVLNNRPLTASTIGGDFDSHSSRGLFKVSSVARSCGIQRLMKTRETGRKRLQLEGDGAEQEQLWGVSGIDGTKNI